MSLKTADRRGGLGLVQFREQRLLKTRVAVQLSDTMFTLADLLLEDLLALRIANVVDILAVVSTYRPKAGRLQRKWRMFDAAQDLAGVGLCRPRLCPPLPGIVQIGSTNLRGERRGGEAVVMVFFFLAPGAAAVSSGAPGTLEDLFAASVWRVPPTACAEIFIASGIGHQFAEVHM